MLFGRDIYDGSWRLFDFDPATGRTVWVLHEDGMMHFRTDQPVDHLIKDNAEARTDVAGKRWGDLARVASIPLNAYYDQKMGLSEAMSQGDSRYLAKFLNNGDNAAWRTREGTI
jgi:hypothetical protein